LLTGCLDMAAEGQAKFGQPACQFFDPLREGDLRDRPKTNWPNQNL
jgi:hypothetical protein